MILYYSSDREEEFPAIKKEKKNVHQYDVVITNTMVSIHTLKALNLVEFVESYQLI